MAYPAGHGEPTATGSGSGSVRSTAPYSRVNNMKVTSMPTSECGFNLQLQKEQLIRKFSESVKPLRRVRGAPREHQGASETEVRIDLPEVKHH